MEGKPPAFARLSLKLLALVSGPVPAWPTRCPEFGIGSHLACPIFRFSAKIPLLAMVIEAHRGKYSLRNCGKTGCRLRPGPASEALEWGDLSGIYNVP